MTNNNVLDPAALLSTLPTLLPASDPTIQNPLSAISALLHTTLVSLSFRLVSHTETPLSPPPSSSVLLDSWASHTPDSHAFLYKHPRSSLTYLFKVVKLADSALIHGRALESPTTASVEFIVANYTSASFWPWTKDKEGAEPLVHGFISSSRVNDLVSLWKVGLIGKLAPGLEKEGYEAQSRPDNNEGPPAPVPARPRQPPPEPEPDFVRPPAHSPFAPRNPLEIGRNDLDPPGLPPSNPFSPPSLFDPNAGGMFVGPSHPMFGLRDPSGSGIGGPQRPRWGGDGWLPEGAVPPGARFDPIGPGPFPGRGIGPLPGRGRFGRGGGSMPPGWGGEPDNDEFLPPDMGDMPSGMRDMFS